MKETMPPSSIQKSLEAISLYNALQTLHLTKEGSSLYHYPLEGDNKGSQFTFDDAQFLKNKLKSKDNHPVPTDIKAVIAYNETMEAIETVLGFFRGTELNHMTGGQEKEGFSLRQNNDFMVSYGSYYAMDREQAKHTNALVGVLFVVLAVIIFVLSNIFMATVPAIYLTMVLCIPMIVAKIRIGQYLKTF